MKRISTQLAILFLLAALGASAVFADDSKREDNYNTTKEFRNRVFEIHNRDPQVIHAAVQLLGSGFKGAGMQVNAQLHTLTVRDFPENIATLEEAIKRLDQPAAEVPDIELRIWVLIGSNSPTENLPPMPEDLAPVVSELRSTLRYAHYALLTATVHRTKPGNGFDNSGIAEPAALGMATRDRQPIFYSYRLADLTLGTSGDRPSLAIDHFRFAMKVPVEIGPSIQYQDIGFDTPVTIRSQEKVVIGTTTMGEKALIVVVTANLKAKS